MALEPTGKLLDRYPESPGQRHEAAADGERTVQRSCLGRSLGHWQAERLERRRSEDTPSLLHQPFWGGRFSVALQHYVYGAEKYGVGCVPQTF